MEEKPCNRNKAKTCETVNRWTHVGRKYVSNHHYPNLRYNDGEGYQWARAGNLWWILNRQQIAVNDYEQPQAQTMNDAINIAENAQRDDGEMSIAYRVPLDA